MTTNPTVPAPVQWPAGYRINPRAEGPATQVVSAFREIPVAAIGDSMSRNVGTIGLRQYHARLDTVLCGPAVTVRVRPGDNLMIHKALTLARAGDVIVVDGGGDLTSALFGEIMVATAVKIGVAGIVLNGAVRDSDEIGQGNFPLYAAGVTHRGPYKDGPGEINVPIAIDGMVIQPGDLIVGDRDGLLCVSYDEAEAVLAATHKKMEAEKKMLADIEAGNLDTSWIDATLKRIGCETEAR